MKAIRPRIKTILLALATIVVMVPGLAPAASAAPETSRALTLENIVISGNTRATESMVRRYMGLTPGSEITNDVIARARGQLLASGYFSSVEIAPRPGSERGQIILVVELKEHGNPVFETGFGYHDLNGWYLTLVGLRMDNALGSDSQFRVGLRLGFRLAGADAEWIKRFRNGRMSLATKLYLYNTQHRFYGSGPAAVDENNLPAPWQGNGWIGYNQNVGRAGAEAALRFHTGRESRIELGARVSEVTPDSIFKTVEEGDELKFASLPSSLRAQYKQTTVATLFLRALHDTRNHPVYPTAGSFARLTLSLSSSELEGSELFGKALLDYSNHQHLSEGVVISSHLAAGGVPRGTPYYERFYLGGNYSIRGFREWSLSATNGDDIFWTINEELRVPLAGRNSRTPRLIGLLFVDAGQGWQHGVTPETSTVQSSAGYGVRVLLPWVGTLGLDVGIPMTDGKTDEAFRAHLLLGFSF